MTHSLLSRDDWQVAWARDPSATVRTEGGPVASTVAEFKESLKRDTRWICGMTLQETALVKRINVVVFEMIQDCWKRTGLIFGSQQNHHKLKTVVLVLHLGHCYSVKASSIPAAWLGPEGVKWCTLGHKDTGYFARGGAVHHLAGPAELELINLGGRGDCGWRIFSYAVALHQGWDLFGQDAEEECIRKLCSEMGQDLRSKVAVQLTEDTSWRPFWAVDPLATCESEGGSIPQTPDELTLQVACNVVGLNIVVWEHDCNEWKRSGIFLVSGHSNSHGTIALALVDNHYMAIKTADVPAWWLLPHGAHEDRLNYVTHRGGAVLCTPEIGQEVVADFLFRLALAPARVFQI